MKTDNNYTGIRVGGALSTPTHINLFINGFLIKTVDLWEGNPTGKEVRKAYKKETIKIINFVEELKKGIELELKQNHPEREIIFDDNFCYSGKPSSQWGGNTNEYKGIKYYFSTPSPSHKDSPLLLIWTFRTEDGNNN
jgi:hypothetical protein